MAENGIAYYGYEQGWEADAGEATQHWVMALFAVSHIAFAVYAVYLRRWEKRKAHMGYFEIQALLKKVHPPRPPIEVNYTNGRRTGLDKKCLTYYGEVKHEAEEQEQEPKKQIKNDGNRRGRSRDPQTRVFHQGGGDAQSVGGGDAKLDGDEESVGAADAEGADERAIDGGDAKGRGETKSAG